MIKEISHQEAITIINVYTSNNRAPNALSRALGHLGEGSAKPALSLWHP